MLPYLGRFGLGKARTERLKGCSGQAFQNASECDILPRFWR